MEYKKVLKFRYALGQGAAAFAIDIEEAVHHGVSRSTKYKGEVKQYSLKRSQQITLRLLAHMWHEFGTLVTRINGITGITGMTCIVADLQ
ncbi:hypothetical protein FH972_000305 [Carpinus fangiana]|uniref:Uncharacterized protein n=1 Tax=Carpinus fangiana TaxID=176857 RepID=A0A5N6QAS4_9ROSI|nr:hypothetical protein FH972_000305 [Carpinus fangiana]